MRVLLVQNMAYVGGFGGAIRSNRIMLEQLAAHGHRCQVVALLGAGEAELDAHLDAYGGRRWAGRPGEDDVIEFDLAGVHAVTVRNGSRLVPTVRRVVAEARPDWILVPSDDPGGLALGVAFAVCPDRVVYLAHTLSHLPFGPAAHYPSAARTRLLHRAAGVVAVSRTAQDRLHRWAGLPSRLIYPQVYGTGPFPRHDGPFVTMVNPCGVKGVAILLGLADAFPRVPFLAVASWGTTPGDRRELARRPNVEVMEAVDDVEAVFARTRLLLMPSLWEETFGYTVVEAMLRGIPVLASELAGLRESTQRAASLLPVRPIERYDTRTDPARPIPVVPPQDLRPWTAELGRLLGDDDARARLGARCRAAATSFVATLDENALAAYLSDLAPAVTRWPRSARPG
jgi:glycosyltransferase involved in cell wall biosynthesis